MRKLLIGLALSVMATSAQAQWVLVTKSDIGDSFYADPTTKRRTGNVVRIWEINDFAKPDLSPNGREYYSMRGYLQYDCTERTSLLLQTTGFTGKMASGESVGSDNQPGSKSFVAPGTIGAAKLDFACK